MTLTEKELDKVSKEIKRILHCHRNAMRQMGLNTNKLKFEPREGFYAEAWGMIRVLMILGHERYFCTDLMEGLMYDVLEEENFGVDNKCEFCYKQFGMDGMRSI